MGLSFEFTCAQNNRRLHNDERETPADRLIIILKVSPESKEVVANRAECGDGVVSGVSVITVGASIDKGEGQRQPGCKIDGEDRSHGVRLS